MSGFKSPVKNGGIFQGPPSSSFDDRVASDGSYDPHSSHLPLLPNRRSHHPPGNLDAPRLGPPPPHLSLSGATYQDFNPQHLYFTDGQQAGKLDAYAYTPSPRDSETDFLKTPLSALFPTGIPKPPRRHPFASGFEAPEWFFVILHVSFCILAYPVLMVFVVIANHRTLFWSRLLVGVGCGAVGVALGLSLGRLSQRFLEAATWATLIHQSRVSDSPGIRMRDLAAGSQYPTSIWAALRLLWNRIFYKGTSRRVRKNYDSRPWSLVVIFFLLLLIISGCLPFILGRVVDIQASIQHQWIKYTEIAISADASDSDIERATALRPTFNARWILLLTFTPASDDPVTGFQVHMDTFTLLQSRSSTTRGLDSLGEDTIYFSETIRSQLLPNGSGFGTFEVNATAASIETNPGQEVSSEAGKSVDAGVLLRYYKWGIRIHCAKFSDPNTIVPRSMAGFTYIFTPRDMLRSLFSSFDMELPSVLEAPLNTTTVMQVNDTLPSSLNVNDIALGASFYDNGVAHSFKSTPVSLGEDGKGFVSIETLLVRLNTTYTPNGTFLRLSDQAMPDEHGQDTFIGQDAAVCLELYEPWIIETYNNSIGVPTTTRIVNKGSVIVNANTTDFEEINIRPPLTDPSLKRQLNSSNLLAVYDVAHGNSANQLLKDNGRDAYYVPSPTLVSFTGGTGPGGYLELSASSFAQARAMGDASNVLSYLVGSGQTVARCYADDILSETRIKTFDAVIVLVIVLFLGVIAGLFVPKLPMSVPRRGFELYSWMAAFYSKELVLDQIDQSEPMVKHLELRDIQRHMGDLKFRYGF
ncbi:hypothetical protein C8R43DRAFT_1122758 [Mycena crocata]|nr:hypothetical protein C8R43DRAFT_1122758 [Mycena crocata]